MEKNKDWLITVRKQKNMTQKELAEMLGLTVNTISHIEQGQRIGSDSTWNKIFEFFGEYEDSMKVNEENIINFLELEKCNIVQIIKEKSQNEVIFNHFIDKDYHDIVHYFISSINTLEETNKVYLYLFKGGRLIKGIYVVGNENYFRVLL